MKVNFTNYLVCFIICFVGFLITSKTKLFDYLLMYVVRLIFNDKLESFLGFVSEATTLREYIEAALYSTKIKELCGGTTVLYLMLIGSKTYVMGLVQIIYNLVFFIIWYILFKIFRLISLIFIILFKSERKYARKVNKDFENNKEFHTYRKERNRGGLIGIAKAFIKGLITITLIGSSTYSLVGRGKGQLMDMEFANTDLNTYYKVFQSFEGYGEQGIYKILNGISDKENVPYYLYFTDLVFGCKVEEDGVTYKFNILNETGEYMDFAFGLVNLAQTYCNDEISGLINGSMGTDEVLNNLVNTFKNNPEFTTRFANVIESFDDETFIIKLGLCAADAIASNIANSSTLNVNENIKELINITFNSSYLCNKIPDENELLLENKTATRPVIKVSQIITKEDVSLLIKTLVNVASIYGTDLSTYTNPSSLLSNTSDLEDAIDYVLTFIRNLTLFKSNPSNFNGYLSRLYCYIENVYLTPSGLEGIRYDSIQKDNINWLNEIDSLLSSYSDILTLYKLYQEEGLNINVLMHNIFDDEYENYPTYHQAFSNLVNKLKTTTMLDKVLNAKLIVEKIQDMMVSLIPDLYIPSDIRYTNRTNRSGEIIEYGELTYLLNAIEIACSDNISLIDKFLPDNSSDSSDDEISDTALPFELKAIDVSQFRNYIDLISNGLNGSSKVDNLTLKQCIIKSKLIRTFASGFVVGLTKSEDSNIPLYIPSSSLETDNYGNTIALIKKDQFESILSDVTGLLDLWPSDDKITATYIKETLNDSRLINLLESKNGIIEGTIGKLIVKNKDNDLLKAYIVIPESLNNLDNWVSSNNKTGETTKIIKILTNQTLKDVLFDFIVDANTSDEEVSDTSILLVDDPVVEEEEEETTVSQKELFTKLIQLINAETANLLFDSKVIQYTMSKMLLDEESILSNAITTATGSSGFTFIFPDTAIEQEVNETSEVIKKTELVSLFTTIQGFDLSNFEIESIVDTLLAKKEKIIASHVLSATISYFLAGIGQGNGDNSLLPFTIPTSLDRDNDGSKENLKEYSIGNGWRSELKAILNALDEATYTGRNEERLCLKEFEYEEGVYTRSFSANDVLTITEYNALPDEYKTSEYFSNNFSINDLTNLINEIPSLNKTAKTNTNKRKIDVICDSKIVMNLVTDKVKEFAVKDTDLNLNGSLGLTMDQYSLCLDSAGVFKKSELVALVDIIDACEITDIMGSDAYDKVLNYFGFGDTSDKTFSDLMVKNVSHNNKSDVDLLFSSTLLKYVLTKTLDDMFKGQLKDYFYDDTKQTESEALLTYLKGSYDYYTQSEFENLLNAIVILGIEDKNSFTGDASGFNITGLLLNANNELDTFTKSKIANRMLTAILQQGIQGTFDPIISSTGSIKPVDEAYAIDTDICCKELNILKASEINTLFSFVKGALNGTDFNNIANSISVENINISKLPNYIFEDVSKGNYKVNSYLLLNTVSSNLIDNDDLDIPDNCIRSISNGSILVIKSDELCKLFNGLTALFGDDVTVSNIGTKVASISVPDTTEKRNTLFASSILRLKVTKYLVESNTGLDIYLFKSHEGTSWESINVNGNSTIVLTSTELTNIFGFLGNGNIEIPNADAETIKLYTSGEKWDYITSSDTLRIAFNNIILSQIPEIQSPFYPTQTYADKYEFLAAEINTGVYNKQAYNFEQESNANPVIYKLDNSDAGYSTITDTYILTKESFKDLTESYSDLFSN